MYKHGYKTILGTVQSGNNKNITYLQNYIVKLYYSDNNSSTVIEETTTNNEGKFEFKINNHFHAPEGSIIYLTAQLDHIKLMSVIGTLENFKSIDNLVINELTTIASAYCFHNFDGMYGNLKGLKVASLMYYNLVKLDGQLSDVITSSPNGNETNSMALLNNFSNIISVAIKDPKMYEIIISYTLNPSSITNTFELITSIIQNSYYNVRNIFISSFVNIIYEPYISSTKNISSFTIAVKVNNTGNNDYLFGGPANLVFDDEDNAWITNNVVQGTPDSSNFSVVLQPNGKPHPISPIINSAIIGEGFGVAKYFDKVIMGNFGWGDIIPDGGITIFNNDGTLLGNKSYDEKMYRVQGITVDIYNNIWACSYGDDSVVVLVNGNVNNLVKYQFAKGSQPFSIEFDNEGYVLVSNKGNIELNRECSLAKMYLDRDNEIKVIFNITLGNNLASGLTVDTDNNTYCSILDTSEIIKIDKYGSIIFRLTGDSIINPWSVTIDKDNSIWVANFSANSNNDYCFSHYSSNGDLIAPDVGYILPSNGDQVLLANGTPLYGEGYPPSFQPLMRLTKIKIDAAGNLWAINNWKPNALIDFISNPGGDGICIFIGLGKPN